MELRHLRYFVAVADERHFGRAAARLHISPPTLSQQIRDLERHLRCRLFERTSRAVELTEAGAVLLVEARSVLGRVEALYSRLEPQPGENTQLRLGVVDASGGELIAPLLAAFRVAHPEIRLEVAPVLMGQQADALATRRVDVVFGATVMFDEGLPIAENALFSEPTVAVLPAQHPLAERPELTVSDLLDEKFAFMPGINQRMLDHFSLRRDRGGEPARRAESGVVSTLDVLNQVALVGSVATMAATAQRLFPRPGVAYRPVVDADHTVLGLYHRHDLVGHGTASAIEAMSATYADALPDLLPLLPGATAVSAA
ncbi:MAG: LysR family transcriptional regulator [Pseudonocardia sp.]|nr:LysR family transcriptional regulator [Pseudonocardia sp.]